MKSYNVRAREVVKIYVYFVKFHQVTCSDDAESNIVMTTASATLITGITRCGELRHV